MDPYVEIVYKKEVQQTQIMENAGKTPEWNVDMNAMVIDQLEDKIKFTVYDKDLIMSEVVGETTIKVGKLCTLDNKKRWLNLTFKGKEAGDLLVESMYTPPAPDNRDILPQKLRLNQSKEDASSLLKQTGTMILSQTTKAGGANPPNRRDSTMSNIGLVQRNGPMGQRQSVKNMDLLMK